MKPQIKMIKTAALIPYVMNSRTHSEQQVAQIAASIKEFGFTNPILTDGENGIIAGHGRLMAAQKLELAEVPVIELSHLSPAQKRAYIIADNKLALNAGWDDEALKSELLALQDEGFNVDLVGFSASEIDTIMNGWNSDLTIPPPSGDESGFKITVKGENEIEKDEVVNIIQRAIDESGIEGVKIV